MYAIAGAGFGLYGYLPAIAGARGGTVVLPESVRAKFEARPELAPFAGAIRWAPDLDAALASASVAVVAVPPAEQPGVVERCLRHPGIGALVLEKPVAATPGEARVVLDAIAKAGKRCRVGYTLLETAWADRLLEAPAAADEPLDIEWSFQAHHFARGVATWKRRHAQGGGALRFYGIHLVALLARLGYRDATHSRLAGADPREPERWLATVAGPGLAEATVVLDCRSPATVFRLVRKRSGFERRLVDLADPFESAPPAGETDRRVAPVARLLATLDEPDEPHRSRLADVQRLWERIEAVTRIEGP